MRRWPTDYTFHNPGQHAGRPTHECACPTTNWWPTVNDDQRNNPEETIVLWQTANSCRHLMPAADATVPSLSLGNETAETKQARQDRWGT